MSEEHETYCRLCADPTPKIQLISPEEDVAISSKIATKLLWINIDITASNPLPNTICFACFDSLERTWSFLHNVRGAQEKLSAIFAPKVDKVDVENVKVLDNPDAGKPVDTNWETFQELKTELKIEKVDKNDDITDDSSLKAACDIKEECRSDNECGNDISIDCPIGYSTDSDLPLLLTSQAKRTKQKHKTKHKSDKRSEGIDVTTLTTTWDNFLCSCGRCDAQCKNISGLQLHSLQIHNACCIFKCLHCNKKFLTYKPFVTHSRTHIKDLRYCCEFCDDIFNKSSHLKRHRNTQHISAYMTKCQHCGMCFDSPEQLKDHQMAFGTEFKRSKRESKTDMILKCEFCDREFKTKSNLQQHKLVHTERSRDFSCHICGKMFFTKGILSTHMLTHDSTKPYKCEHCPLAFRARGNLQSHLSRHSGTKPFVCEQCGKSFRVKRHLKSHSIVHTDLMPYTCEFCNKAFRFKTRLNMHLRQHTGAKPYQCMYCRRDFTNGSNYKKHMKRRHGIDTSRQKYDNIVVDVKPLNGDEENLQT